MPHQNSYRDLIRIFNELFRERYQTVLVKGEDEPLYQPANGDNPLHQVVFARGYFSSALHEISHWCIAGAERRQLVDYGYWYVPDGRSEQQQKHFEQVEIKPQALEWIFSIATGHPFHLSIDNLGGEAYNRQAFAEQVSLQARCYLRQGLPLRAAQFAWALVDYYDGLLSQEAFVPEALY